MMIRVGFIGAGGITLSHLTTLMRLDDVEVVAMSDLSTERVKETVARANDRIKTQWEQADEPFSFNELSPAAYDNFGEMLSNERIDAAYICLPPFAHGEPEDAVIDAGIPMLIEKPLALDLPLANRLLKKIRESDLLTAVGYQLRYTPEFSEVKKRLSGKTIGMVTAMRHGGTPGVPWYHRQDKSGGQLTEMATHEVDLIRFLVGEVDRVYAEADTRINHKSNPDYDIFDVNSMTLRMKNGAVGSFTNGFISGFGGPANTRGLHIMAEGVAVSYQIGGPIEIVTAEGKEVLPTSGNPMAYEDKAFIEAVKTNNRENILSTYEDGVRTLAVTIAADRSARTGEVVNIDDLVAKEAPELLR